MTRIAAALIILSLASVACGRRAPSIDFGKAECAHCRMNVVDRQFAAAVVTTKGRQYVFDDLACMVQHVADGAIAEDQVEAWYVCDHAHPGALIDATSAFYLSGPAFRSPMRGDVAAFAAEADRENARVEDAVPLDWNGARSQALK